MKSEAMTTPKPRAHSSRKRGLTSSIIEEFAPHEILLLVFSVLFSLIAVIGSQRVTQWPYVLIDMVIASGLIIAMSFWSLRAGSNGSAGRWVRLLRLFYLFPVIPIYFTSAGYMSNPLHGHDFDSMFIAADRLIFGVNPTVWLFEHFPTWPWMTEYLMICYTIFYFLPLGLAVELYRRARKKDTLGHTIPFSFGGVRDGNQHEPVDQVVFVIVYGFMLSYLGYLFFPSIGPRFTLHNFLNLSNELPGLFLTEPLRTLLNRGEGVVPGMSMPAILSHVNRDAFPSGHTDITLLTIFLAFQFRARLRWPIAIIGSSLIFSTVYLRYHYVIDLIAALVLATFTLYTWHWVRDGMLRLKERFIR
jgi:membrane-associated phospholipid phosphatase